MVMKAYSKTVMRTVRDNLGRFVAITSIILLGIALVAGLGTLSPKMKNSIDRELNRCNAADIVLKSAGFTDEQLAAISGFEGVAAADGLTVLDLPADGKSGRAYFLPAEQEVNRIDLLEGEMPAKAGEALFDRASKAAGEYEVGDEVTIDFMGMETKVKIVGIASNAMIYNKDGEPNNDQELLNVILYLNRTYYPTIPGTNIPLPVTDVWVRAEDAVGLNFFSKKYEETVENLAESLESAETGAAAILTMRENKSWALVDSYTQKINVVTLIFPVFFTAVAALVVLSTMTRLIEEERPALGCYRSLGYRNGRIAFKYLGFVLACCVIGSAIGFGLGVWILPAAVYPAFSSVFFMPAMAKGVSYLAGGIASAAMFVAAAGTTTYVVLRELRAKPASLLKPKAPKAGKKIFLEHVPFIWNHLKFKYKSTYRNIFRYVRNLLMTVISVAGSTALVFAGFGLYDLSQHPEATGLPGGMAESFGMISFVVILFAAALCVLVVYNLTNMNIGERKREIATLKVLGYRAGEVAGYIYREVFIMALLGIVFGIPLGYGLLYFVFAYMDFGTMSVVQWQSYLYSVLLVVVFVALVDLLLARKIRKIDMNSALKSVE